MKKKTVALCGIAALAGLSLASCNGNKNLAGGEKPAITISTTHNYTEAPADEVYDTDGGRLDIHISYKGSEGITYRKDNSLTNAVDNVTYGKGDLLPVWETFAKKTRTTIHEACGYTTTDNQKTYDAVAANNFVSEVDGSQKIDLLHTTTKNINNLGTSGGAVNLLEHLDDMPNFEKFLEKNPTIKKQLLKGDKIFYTPYFDGYNDIERMFIMDSQVAADVLDASDFTSFDQTINGGANPAANVVQSATYTPFMDAKYNYADKTEVQVLVGEEVQTIELKKVKNIIVRQNELLAEGCTGAQLAEQFRTYLNEVFGKYIGEGNIFESYSDIFCSESAAYNADELIALMRVVKANPGVITKDATAEVETFFPRGNANNRVDNIADFMQIWGIQGFTSEKEMLYFDANGKLNDAATTPQTYEALQKLSQIYDEGLIVDEFWYKPTNSSGNYFLDKYFKKTADESGYGLLMYDYAASQCVANDIADGVGTKPSARKIQVEQFGIKPILPPLTYWNVQEDSTHDVKLTDFSNKTLMRYAEENRSLKDGSWCVPTTSDNVDGALRLMDYLFSPRGAMIQDFGPEAYWQQPNTANGDTVVGKYDADKVYVCTDIVQGQLTPVIATPVKAMLANSSFDFWTFMRAVIGNTHGIGCERSKGLDVQATNAYGAIGLSALKGAIAKGVVNLALVDKDLTKTTWDTTVPTAGYDSIAEAVANTYECLTEFWASTKCGATATGWVAVVAAKAGTDMTNEVVGTATIAGEYTYGKVLEQMEIKNKSYLFTMSNSLGEAFVPDYAKTNE